jgi:uncharacterized protein YabE (DUF348 family)
MVRRKFEVEYDEDGNEISRRDVTDEKDEGKFRVERRAVTRTPDGKEITSEPLSEEEFKKAFRRRAQKPAGQ